MRVSATLIAAAALSGSLLLTSRPAQACGGLFCNASQPVNQAAERILFVDHGDGTQTAVIEIQYQGPSSSFSWVLPVPGSPQVAVSSKLALDRLQQATNPQFRLNTMRETECDLSFESANAGGSKSGGDDASGESAGPPAVSVIAMGTVGPFDYQVISVRDDLAEPADAAIMWLEDNGYDVTALGPSVLGPYLENGLNLIGFRLTSNSDAGSIRPIMITYDATLPFIPIRPTAVAAKPDMGIMVWVAADGRAVPDNFKALEINEALIDWFNPMSTYDDVVSRAADEAGGQGFVTEMAADSDMLTGAVLYDYEADAWRQISGQSPDDAPALFSMALANFGGWDGFGEVVTAAVTLPAGVSTQDFIDCTQCWVDDPAFAIDGDMLLTALYEKVYKPVAETDRLLLSRPYVTRLYTTMSAAEMTMDPAFDFNQDLDDVSNIHTATQLISCEGDTWHMRLPQGDVVYGTQTGVWPMEEMDDQPAARKILMLGSEGQGEIIEDNSKAIETLLDDSAEARGDTTGDGACRVSNGAAGSTLAGHGLLWSLALGWLARRRPRR